MGKFTSEEPFILGAVLWARLLPLSLAQSHSWLGALVTLVEDLLHWRVWLASWLVVVQAGRLRTLTDQMQERHRPE